MGGPGSAVGSLLFLCAQTCWLLSDSISDGCWDSNSPGALTHTPHTQNAVSLNCPADPSGSLELLVKYLRKVARNQVFGSWGSSMASSKSLCTSEQMI